MEIVDRWQQTRRLRIMVRPTVGANRTCLSVFVPLRNDDCLMEDKGEDYRKCSMLNGICIGAGAEGHAPRILAIPLFGLLLLRHCKVAFKKDTLEYLSLIHI